MKFDVAQPEVIEPEAVIAKPVPPFMTWFKRILQCEMVLTITLILIFHLTMSNSLWDNEFFERVVNQWEKYPIV